MTRCYIHMATHSLRAESYSLAVRSLLYQTVPAKLYVYANDYSPKRQGVETVAEAIMGNLGDAGKFFMTRSGWNLFVDDDIIYPVDYVERMIECSLRNGCPVGVHSAVLPPAPKDYFKDRIVLPFWAASGREMNVNVLGTGTLCWHSNQLDFSLEHCPTDNMSDCHFAAFCQKRSIPLVSISRKANWLQKIMTKDSLWAQRGNGEKQTKVIQQVPSWVVHG